MHYAEMFRVRPGQKLRLKKIDAAFKGHHEAEAAAAVEIEHYRRKMAKSSCTGSMRLHKKPPSLWQPLKLRPSGAWHWNGCARKG